MVLALIVVGAVAALSSGYLMLSAAVTNRQDSEVENLRAFYLAEAGLNEAYFGLRIGKTGQVASQNAPAAFGEGMLWVNASELEDDRIQLDSTALCGSGRATLSLIVEKVETPLGFFTDEDLIIDEVLLVDGFDSQDAPYIEQTVNPPIPEEEPAPTVYSALAYTDVMYLYKFAMNYGGESEWLDEIEGEEQFLAALTASHALIHGMDGTYTYDPSLDTLSSPEAIAMFTEWLESQWAVTPVDQDATYLDSTGFGTGTTLDSGTSLEPVSDADYLADDTDPIVREPVASTTEVHTSGGGLLGSNGNITFQNPTGEPVEVYGDIVPGAEGSVVGDAYVTGDSEPRDEAIELPEVELPQVEFQAAVQHASAIPMIISPSIVGYERIDVAADAGLLIRGPATVVVGSLTLASGAELTLDTTNGAVNLFITSQLDLEPGSVVTTSEVPQDLNIQVAAIPTVGGEAPVQLEAQSQFHGAIYAPDTEVKIGSDFEVYGGIVARRLDLAAGVRLHFDNAGFDSLPRLISWKIVEIPSGVRTLRGNPFVDLGIKREDLTELADSHNLDGIMLDVTYLSKTGAELAYDGAEENFDWGGVDEVVEAERSGGTYGGTWDSSGWWDAWMDWWSNYWDSTSSSDDYQGQQ